MQTVVHHLTDSITDVTGITVGCAQDRERLTGCTVVLCPVEGAVVGVDVRGAAPATRETDLCRSGTLVQRSNAIFLTGGSAFGLDAAAGVMRYLRERGIGFATPAGPVPIVPAAAIFDLAAGEVAWPDPEMAYAACAAAGSEAPQGLVGAGIGATIGKLRGSGQSTRSGQGTASARVGEYTVGAIFVVNAVGEVDISSSISSINQADPAGERTNTTIGVVATDAPLTQDQVSYLARVAHDGLARSIHPAHTLFDGDAIFALSTGSGSIDWSQAALPLHLAAVDVTERAIRNAVRSVTSRGYCS